MQLLELLTLCVKVCASDLHLSPGLSPRVRIHGELIQLENVPAFPPELVKHLIHSIMTAEQRDAFSHALELDFSIEIPALARFRVNAFQQHHGAAAVFRLIPDHIPTLTSLHFPAVIKSLLHLPNGIILISGATGSGKSTTQAAMINDINLHQQKHIITIEDPIEFIHTSQKSLITQRQLHRDTHDMSNALRSALREDPDIILLGEIRDTDTIRLALTAAETGHLVIATLHASSASRSINRIVDVFPANEKSIIRHLLSESLQAVICQSLFKKEAGGRMASLEIMLGTPAIRNLIREDKIAQMNAAIETGSESGMCTHAQYRQRFEYIE